jgi:hypothetical protein
MEKAKGGYVMKERPILLSGEWVRRILEGNKSQTRRPIFRDGDDEHHMPWRVGGTHWQDGDELLTCPFGAVGDRLWVRETWTPFIFEDESGSPLVVFYRAACPDLTNPGPWKSSRFMPRWASRIDLAITDVRAERLQSMKLRHALAEGVESVDEFREGWEAIYGKRGHPWASNPWVWVVAFDVLEIRSGMEPATVGATP